jgi:hypothetical protein
VIIPVCAAAPIHAATIPVIIDSSAGGTDLLPHRPAGPDQEENDEGMEEEQADHHEERGDDVRPRPAQVRAQPEPHDDREENRERSRHQREVPVHQRRSQTLFICRNSPR